MHYYPSTYDEICQAVMNKQTMAAYAGRKLVGITLGRFQMNAIAEENPGWCSPTDFLGEPAPQIIGVPVIVVEGWHFQTEEK